MSGLWRSNHETLQYVRKFLFLVFQNLLLPSLSNRLDVCKQRSSFLLFDVAHFLSRVCLRVKADLFFWQNDSGKKFKMLKFPRKNNCDNSSLTYKIISIKLDT